ncbi:hypothetical protein [Sphingobacterium spiritivorum]|uniref:hypothetical protein n=1 Tax=Sphingobacterium spiritivorum TaxID=258 RepID=UPI003DA5A2D1
MKAISKRQHRAIIYNLQQLEDLQQVNGVLPAGDFFQHVQFLNERFSQYEALLSQLADCITEYETLQKEIRVNVVAPALRQARKQLDSKSTKAMQLRGQLASAQGF